MCSCKALSPDVVKKLTSNHIELAKLMDRYSYDLKHYAPYLIPVKTITFSYWLNHITAYVVVIEPVQSIKIEVNT